MTFGLAIVAPGAAAQAPITVVGEAWASGQIPAGEYAGRPFIVLIKGAYSGYGGGTLVRGEVVIDIGGERFLGIVDPAVPPSLCCGEGEVQEATDAWPALFSLHGRVRHANPPHEHLFAATATTDGRMTFNLADQSGTVVEPPPPIPPHNPGVGMMSLIPATVSIRPEGLGSWMPTGAMSAIRRDHTATLLLDGRVLVVGGTGSGAQLYDPATGTFTATTGQPAHYYGQGTSATRLADGRVLVAGGPALKFAEVYDPVTGLFSAGGDMNVGRRHHTATLLQDGRVLVTGGYGNGYADLQTSEIYTLVRSPEDLLRDLEDLVAGTALANSLGAKVRAAKAALEAGDTGTVCALLNNAIGGEVRAQTGKKLTEAQAAEILAVVASLAAVLPCGP